MSNFAKLSNHFPQLKWQENALLAPFTYMKVGGPAEVLWEAQDLDQLVEVVRFARQSGMEVTILGGASNVVVLDEGVTGLVIINQCSQIQKLDESALPPALTGIEGKQYFQAESGIKTALLVRQSVDFGFTGLEPFLGVPGTLGGAIYNNAHYRAQELIGNFVLGVEILTSEGNRQWLIQSECDFAYDYSRFHHTSEVILRVIFALAPGEAAASLEIIREATVKRASTQPLGTANSGCMFRNYELPEAEQARFEGKSVLPAGWLIDQAGLKGLRVGDAVVSDKHANFIINEGNATATDVEQLVALIQEKVLEKFGVKLHTEVFFLGRKGAQNAKIYH